MMFRSTLTTITKKTTITLLVAVTVVFSVFIEILLHSPVVNAVSASDFKAGYIISDSIFTAKGSMNVSQIQNFLNSKVPNCDTDGSQRLDSGFSASGVPDYNGNGIIQRWEWGKKKYNQTTFPCLKDKTFNGLKAAKVIYDAAQEFSISPKVLIVLLQKEQGLVTDTWPLNLQYRAATGYGCPDTAACDTDYYGFKNQVRWAARMFRAILNDSPTWYTPYELGNNSIPWHPDTGRCGYSTVNIQNRSTQALYNYTPYRPNSAALNAGYGMGNSCSSYGNRNFFLYFSDWFGSTTSAYDAEVMDVSLYSDAARQNEINLTGSTYNISPSQTVYVTVNIKNIGSKTLSQSFTRVGTTSDTNRTSAFADNTWLSGGRPTAIQQASLDTNSEGVFQFSMKAPRDIGTFTEKFGIVAEYIKWISKDSITLPLKIVPSLDYDVKIVSNTLYSNSGRTHSTLLGTAGESVLKPGQKIYGKLVFKNIGAEDLPATVTKLATTSPRDRTDSDFYTGSWLSTNRLVLLETSVATGQTSTINYEIATSAESGVYSESFGLVAEDLSWADTEKINISLEVDEHAPYIRSGEELAPGEFISFGSDRLTFQTDSNVVLYRNSKAIWHTNTHGLDATRLVMQSDGNFVLYRNSTPLWHTRTGGKGYSKFILQADGNMVIYNSNSKPTWWTGTNR